MGVKINIGETEVTGYGYKRQCHLGLSSLQLGNGKPKIVMLWDPVKYLGVSLTITGDLTFERDYVRKKTLNTIKQLTQHMFTLYFQVLYGHCELGFKDIETLQNLQMHAFKKARKVNASLPDVTFWAEPE